MSDLCTPDGTAEIVAAACGCVGTALIRHRGQYPYVAVRISVPCPDGHPERVSAGVVERFPQVVPAVELVVT